MAPTLENSIDAAGRATVERNDLATNTLLEIGSRVRELRRDRSLTLKQLADRTGLSSSLLSLVERGKTSPSIGTLVSIAHAFEVHMSDLMPEAPGDSEQVVLRSDEQRVFATPGGVNRRILRDDRVRGLEVAVNEYGPGGRSADTQLHHSGFEYGVVIEGTLHVELDGEAYELQAGDSIAYSSNRPHRIINHGPNKVRAMWVNLD